MLSMLSAYCFSNSRSTERGIPVLIHQHSYSLTGNLSLANMAKDGLANLGESLEEAFADLNIPFQLSKVQILSLIAYFHNKLT